MMPQGPGSSEKVLSVATRQAVEAAGGADVILRETALGRSQLYRCMSVNDMDTLSLRHALTVDRLGDDPAILRAYARILNAVVVRLPDVADMSDSFVQSVMAMSAELGDVSRAIGDALRDGRVEPREALAAIVEVNQVIDLAVALRHQLAAIADATPAGATPAGATRSGAALAGGARLHVHR